MKDDVAFTDRFSSRESRPELGIHCVTIQVFRVLLFSFLSSHHSSAVLHHVRASAVIRCLMILNFDDTCPTIRL